MIPTGSYLPPARSTADVSLPRETYFACWERWLSESPREERRNHAQAVALMKTCLQNDNYVLALGSHQLKSLPPLLPPCHHLWLSDNFLTQLPASLPPMLKVLDVSNNLLTQLPESLPAGLNELYALNNPLRTLPAALPIELVRLNAIGCQLEQLPEQLPAGLRFVFLSRNHISQLPRQLPASLTCLALEENQLATLPDALPEGLLDLNLARNQFTGLPEALLSLTARCTVNMNVNPLDEEACQQLHELLQAADRSGPRIYFPPLQQQPTPVRKRLSEVVAEWYPPLRHPAVLAQWQPVDGEPEAVIFCRFLQRLARSINARHNPAFRLRISNWLNRLITAPGLRNETFMLAREANGSCEDRITFYLHEMAKLDAVHAVMRGDYDHQLAGLVRLARQHFRLEQLALAARKKVASRHSADEIEVWLAFQVQLRNALQLDSVAEKMRFPDAGYLDAAELAGTLHEIQVCERAEFPRWLAQWPAWQSLLQRLDAPLHAAAVRQREALLAEFYPQLINAEALAVLREAGVEQDDDARHTVCKNICEQKIAAIDLQLTRQFLAARQLEQLLTADDTLPDNSSTR